MSIINAISEFAMPIVIFIIIGYGFLCKINVYNEFVEGTKEGFKTVINIAPALVGLLVAVGVLRASGGFELLGNIVGHLCEKIEISEEIFPLCVIRLFSSSAANGLLIDIYKEYGPDSKSGLMASVILSCTEAMFYTISVYFMAVKPKGLKGNIKTGWTLPGALVATGAGIITSILITKFMIK